MRKRTSVPSGVVEGEWTPIDRTVRDPEVRVALLAVCLVLKDRNDAAPVKQGADIDAILDEYGHIERLRARLGPITVEEQAAADKLWVQLSR